MNRSRWPAIATLASLLACYGTLMAVAALGAMGFAATLNESLWAGSIVVFAVLAIVALFLSRKRHGSNIPLILAVIGTIDIAYAMFVDYSLIMELAGFGLLIAAVWVDWRRS